MPRKKKDQANQPQKHSPQSVREQLGRLLGQSPQDGSHVTSGTIIGIVPRLTIQGVGPVAFPDVTEPRKITSFRSLIKASEPAP